MPDDAFLPNQTTFGARDVELALSASSEGQSLLEAWRRERRVPAAVRDAFLEDVANRVRAGSNVRLSIHDAIRDHYRMLVPAPQSAMPSSLTNICSTYGLLRDAERAGRLPSSLSVADAEAFHELILRSPDLAASSMPPVLREGQPLVWWTDSRQLRGLDANQIRNQLALAGDRYAPCAYLVEVALLCAEISALAVPTVLDAGDNPPFRPVAPGLTAGRTAPLNGETNGLPEWVSRPVSTARATWIARGHVDTRLEEVS